MRALSTPPGPFSAMHETNARSLGAHEARLDSHDAQFAHIREDLRDIRDSLKHLEEMAQLGRGALLLLLKLGAVAAVALGFGWGLWRALSHP
jgi:hypothetical protein